VASLLLVAPSCCTTPWQGHRRRPAGDGVVRALNVGVGIALGALAWSAVGAAAIVFAYVLVLTLVSRFEVMRAPVTLVRGAAAAFAVLLAAAIALFVLDGDRAAPSASSSSPCSCSGSGLRSVRRSPSRRRDGSSV